jgi:hypothetical protein
LGIRQRTTGALVRRRRALPLGRSFDWRDADWQDFNEALRVHHLQSAGSEKPERGLHRRNSKRQNLAARGHTRGLSSKQHPKSVQHGGPVTGRTRTTAFPARFVDELVEGDAPTVEGAGRQKVAFGALETVEAMRELMRPT